MILLILKQSMRYDYWQSNKEAVRWRSCDYQTIKNEKQNKSKKNLQMTVGLKEGWLHPV